MTFNTMIKTASALALGAALLAGTAQSAMAQSDSQASGQLTRAEVEHQLAALQSVGYDWAANDNDYPNDLQAAEQRLVEKNSTQRQASASTQNVQ
jgi:Domain of unknown function (DUF4148)